MPHDKVMLITGTRKGIGNYLMQYYAERDYQVIGCSRGPLETHPTNYRHYCLDITDEQAVKKMFTEVRQIYQRLDVLVNNAAIMATNHALLTPLKTVEAILQTNIAGTFLCCREAAKIMQKNKFGRIVNFGSVSSRLKIAGEAVYAASKSGVITLTEILAKELAAFNITANVICPNPIQTDIIGALSQEKVQKVLEQQAIPHLGEFADVSNVIDFFIKPESRMITGQVIFLGGV